MATAPCQNEIGKEAGLRVLRRICSRYGLTTSDILSHLGEELDEIDIAFIEAAKDLAVEGEIEVDSNAITSRGDDEDGCYVSAWLWVPRDNVDLPEVGEPDEKTEDPDEARRRIVAEALPKIQNCPKCGANREEGQLVLVGRILDPALMTLDPALPELEVEVSAGNEGPRLRCSKCGEETMAFQLPTLEGFEQEALVDHFWLNFPLVGG